MKGRNAQVSRIYKILNILDGSRFGMSVSDLCESLHDRGFEVTKRTVYRDLDALRSAGFPLEEKGKDGENGAKWTLENNAKITHHLVLNARELLALYLARGMLLPLKETPFYADLESTFNKIETKLSEKGQSYLTEVSNEVHFEPGPKWGLGLSPEIIDTIRAACTERQQLKINYSSQNTKTTNDRIVGPHFLYFAKGSLYLIAEELSTGINKTFSLPRVNSAEMLEEAYEGKEVDADEYFSNSMGIYSAEEPVEVKLKFFPPVAQYVSERSWHKSQRVVNRENGEIEMTLEVGITPELVQWVLGFGGNVKVQAPNLLVEKLMSSLRDAERHYLDKAV